MPAWSYPNLADDFNRGNESPLTGDGVFTSWVAYTGPTQLDLVSGVVQPPFVGTRSNRRWSIAQYGPDVASSLEIADWYRFGGTGGEWDVYVNISGGGLVNSYRADFAVDFLGRPAFCSLRRLGATPWFYPCALALMPARIAAGDAFGIQVEARAIEFWFRTLGVWTLIDQADDAALSGGAAALPAGWGAIELVDASAGPVGCKAVDYCIGPVAAGIRRLPVLGAG